MFTMLPNDKTAATMAKTEKAKKARKPRLITNSPRVLEYLKDLERRKANGEYKLSKLGEWIMSGESLYTFDDKDLKYIMR